MFPDQLKKILKLIKKTGGKVVIYSENEPDSSYVLMNLEEYEGLLNLETEDKIKALSDDQIKTIPDLTVDNLTDRINCDILAWKNQENSLYLAEESKARNPWAIPVKIKNGAQKIE